jgi:two-component system OmpR family response regulator
MRMLLIEDDRRLTETLSDSLRSEGYAVDTAASAEDGRWMATEVAYDAIILDVGLPDGDGIELCAALRDAGVWAPVLILTAHAAIDERVRGLDAGADDYLGKPFAFDELVARVRALLRRGQLERPSVLVIGSMRLDPAARRVFVDDLPLPITGRAFAILELLARQQGQLVTRSEITEHVWDWAWDGTSNVIDVHVSALRAVLRDHPGAPTIETVRGAGFILRPGDRPEAVQDGADGPARDVDEPDEGVGTDEPSDSRP